MQKFTDSELLEIVIHAALLAGKKILDIYKTDFEVDYKADESPLTIADKSAHKIIEEKLIPTNIPVLSEEGKHLPYSTRKNWEKLWIVDPLDGTKEFIKRNGEFTVNIALIEKNQPKMGVIFCPTLKILYFADYSVGGAYRLVVDEKFWEMKTEPGQLVEKSEKLPLKKENRKFTVVASRSHLTEETKSFVAKIEDQIGDIQFVSRGSSLKLCMVAEGGAELYPRFAPTSEWDTAAGQAIVEHSGGRVLIAEQHKPMTYNKENILNPWFLVLGKDVENKIKL
jgi:3'(2'), 5'-bisphosphate nucleotidase